MRKCQHQLPNNREMQWDKPKRLGLDTYHTIYHSVWHFHYLRRLITSQLYCFWGMQNIGLTDGKIDWTNTYKHGYNILSNTLAKREHTSSNLEGIDSENNWQGLIGITSKPIRFCQSVFLPSGLPTFLSVYVSVCLSVSLLWANILNYTLHYMRTHMMNII